MSFSICILWFFDNIGISFGLVGYNFIVVVILNFCFFIIFGVKFYFLYYYEVYEM